MSCFCCCCCYCTFLPTTSTSFYRLYIGGRGGHYSPSVILVPNHDDKTLLQNSVESNIEYIRSKGGTVQCNLDICDKAWEKGPF